MQEKFIGAKRVEFVVDEDTVKTPAGNPVVRVHFADKSVELMPKSSYELVVSTAASDANILREIKLMDLTKQILKVIAENDLKLGEIDDLNRRIGAALFENANRATNFLWTKDDKTFVPGFNCVLEQSVLDVEEILKTIPLKDNAAEAAK